VGLLSSLRRYFIGGFDASMLVDSSSVGDVEALPGVQRAVEGVASMLASVSICVYDSQDQEVYPAALNLLTGRATELVNGWDLRRWLVTESISQGNAYAYLARTYSGEVAEIIPIDRGRVTIDWSANPFRYLLDGQPISSADLIHVKSGYSRWAFIGESPLDKCRTQLELIANLDQWAATMAATGTTRRLAFKFPTPISEQAKQSILLAWKAKHTRTTGAGEPLIIDGGGSIEGVSGSDDLSALTNARTAAMGEIARALNIPLSFLAATESGTQVTLDAQRALVDQTLRPWARRIEAELMAKLLPGYRVEHDLQELLRGTMKDTAKELSKLVMGGILTPNDARWFIGMQPVKDPMADELMQRLDTAAGQAEVNGDREDEESESPDAD
jgi:HK97 family phage portal protein